MGEERNTHTAEGDAFLFGSFDDHLEASGKCFMKTVEYVEKRPDLRTTALGEGALVLRYT